jgi:hypothetical protein
MSPSELEERLLPRYAELYDVDIPEEAKTIYQSETAQRVPTGIGYHDGLGWFVLQSSGQGPYLIWQENKSVKLSDLRD